MAWFTRMMARSDHTLLVASLWWCWKWRNNHIFSDSPWSLNYVLRHVWLDVQAWRRSSPSNAQVQQANTEPDGVAAVVLKVDGSWLRGVNRMGCGGVLCHRSGAWIVGFSVSHGFGSPFLAEVLAIERGLRLAWELGYRSFTCASDSRNAIDVLTSAIDTSMYWASDTIHRVRSLLAQDWSVTLRYIPRERNLAADCLARQASRDSTTHRVWRLPPSFVVPFLCQEELA
ncbi:hypothetical protein OROGR_029255 [Orobanche gracilis]